MPTINLRIIPVHFADHSLVYIRVWTVRVVVKCVVDYHTELLRFHELYFLDGHAQVFQRIVGLVEFTMWGQPLFINSLHDLSRSLNSRLFLLFLFLLYPTYVLQSLLLEIITSQCESSWFFVGSRIIGSWCVMISSVFITAAWLFVTSSAAYALLTVPGFRWLICAWWKI